MLSPLFLILLLVMIPAYTNAATIKSISACDGSMVLMDDGTVYAWGNIASHSIPEKVPGLTNITAISTYRANYMALKDDGTVYMLSWLSSPDAMPLVVKVPITGVRAISVPAMLRDDGTVWEIVCRNSAVILDSDSASLNVRRVAGLDDVVAIGNQVALGKDGSVWVWGLARNNTLGDPREGDLSPARLDISGVKAVAVTDIGGMALKEDGTVWSWGLNYGQFGNGKGFNEDYYTKENITKPVYDFIVFSKTPVQANGINNVVAISAGLTNEMALKEDGTVWVWGDNAYNILGYFNGDIGSSQRPYSPRMLDSLSNVVAISLGDNHAMALKSDGTLWAWGANYKGQLGDGTVTPVFERNGGKDRPVKVLIDTSGPYSASTVPIASASPLPSFNATVSPVLSINPTPVPSAGGLTFRLGAMGLIILGGIMVILVAMIAYFIFRRR